MTQHEFVEIVPGSIVEFFEAKQVLCGVCEAVKGQRMTILTEQDREINLAQSRVIHVSRQMLNLNSSRDEQVQRLQVLASHRKGLMDDVSVEELWSLLETEDNGYDARELAEFVFSGEVTENHVAAVQRVLFQDKLYFQYKDGKFYARPQDKVEQRRIEIDREVEREAQLEEGSLWLSAVWNRKTRPVPLPLQEIIIGSLKGYALFGQESSESVFVKELLKRANVPPQPQTAFRLLVRLGVWKEDENLYLHEANISPDFPQGILETASRIASITDLAEAEQEGRLDLRHLSAFTVDSALTRDYDDALSIEKVDEAQYEIGVHIADAAAFVPKGGPLDQEAQVRASTIYLPDGRIAMLPTSLSEGVCSLKAGEDRPALSFLFRINSEGNIVSQRITPSLVRISEQMTYEEVNDRVGRDPLIKLLHEFAVRIRNQRLERGAIILPLPEVHVYVNDAGMIQISRYEKETPSQIMVSEWMIAANGLAASFLGDRGIPAIFRGQAECKQETEFVQSEHEIFRIYRQRRLFSRAEMDTEPHAHCSLALPSYTTVTSPIRRYSDLVVQRQIKHALLEGMGLYSQDELRQLITKLGAALSKIFYIQRRWTRYWILKYMEQEDIHNLNAIVLEQNDRFAHLLIPDFLMETNLPLPDKTGLQPGEMIRVKIERLVPRDDTLRVHL